MAQATQLPSESNIAVITARIIELILAMPFEQRRELLKELEENQTEGKRKGHRKSYYMEVNFATLGRVYNGFINNISTEGMLIETRRPLPVGQQIILSFKLPESRIYVKMVGEVVRVAPQGIGVRFKQKVDGSLAAAEENRRIDA